MKLLFERLQFLTGSFLIISISITETQIRGVKGSLLFALQPFNLNNSEVQKVLLFLIILTRYQNLNK